jgi:hypothetical protein
MSYGKRNLIYVHKGTAAFLVPIFAKLTNGQQLCLQISCSEFQPNGTMNVGSADSNPFTPLSKVQPSTTPIFTKQ